MEPSPAPEPPRSRAWRRGLGVIALGALVALVAGMDVLHEPLARLLAVTTRMIDDSPLTGGVLFVLLAAVSGVVAFFSSAVVVPIAVDAWGPTRSAMLLWLGWILGGACTYWIGRYLSRPIVRRLVSKEQIARYEQKLGREAPFGLVVLFQLAMPSEVPGYLLGLARYSFARYILVVILGELPWAIGTVVLGDSLINRRVAPALALAATAAVFTALTYGALHRRLAAAAPAKPDAPSP